MKTTLIALLLSTAPATAQEPAADAAGGGAEPESAASAARVEALKTRIHDMRTNLLLGGDHVRSAEAQAVEFYGTKLDAVDQRIDTIEVDLTEKRASYDATLRSALAAPDPAARKAATDRAMGLRAEIDSLSAEAEGLRGKRGDVVELIAAVEARGRERERLATRLETSGDFRDELYGLPLGAVGLAPTTTGVPRAGSVFDDPQLMRDMLEQDPIAASRLFYETDPERYWQHFPLRPPEPVLREALPFPLPDLPGRR